MITSFVPDAFSQTRRSRRSLPCKLQSGRSRLFHFATH